MNAPQVHHPQFGSGTVLLDNGATRVVRFAHGIEEVAAAELEDRASVLEAAESGAATSPLEAIVRVQAAVIRSLNDAWGVFSRSRIALLPHQLWVCHRALREWPIRLLIADDVGLGKTIEAGLILWPLISRGVARRVLILTPAALVEQWQYRLRTMFDIRLSMYRPEVDTPRADFWSTHSQVVASLPTVRLDNNDRHERLLDAPAWDLVIVDEAHHLNADENTGKTLGYQLLEKLISAGKMDSCVLFTGTPHRGKSYGFWSLLRLLRPDRFDPDRDDAAQLSYLREVMIRNCKQRITDMRGQRLFQPIRQYPETYSYSPEEEHFYQLMTQFIQQGKAYAQSETARSRAHVMLVLTALQKLASSSVAAVRAALTTRRNRLLGVSANYRRDCEAFAAQAVDESDTLDRLLREYASAEKKNALKLMENEIQHLDELLLAAGAVYAESRIRRVLEVIEARFGTEPVLLFTEYKATQALIVSALVKRYGQDTVGFINGDDRLDGVVLDTGERVTLNSRREAAAQRFNSGVIRFLVSTEAGGEGIDLQSRCHCLIHVDLPWNPMRLHQRVGRLNRYGQRYPVEVVSLRNPDTIESRIWAKLEEKLGRIMAAFGAAMDEPEDLLQLVLGMVNPSLFDELFAGAAEAPRERFDDWFDERTQRFGGCDAINAVANLVGHAARFDLSGLADVPQQDLPDLLPFFRGMLQLNGRRPELDNDVLSFVTPDAWMKSPGVRSRYEGLLFRRDADDPDVANRIVGVGHQVFDRALAQALDLPTRLAIVPGIAAPLAVFTVRDRVTVGGGQIRQTIVGVEGEALTTVLRDWEVLLRMNTLIRQTLKSPRPLAGVDRIWFTGWLMQARIAAWGQIESLDLPFSFPELEEYAVLLPDKITG